MSAPRLAAMYFVLATPGAALAALQAWGPVILAIAGIAGTALAIAVSNYRARVQQDSRIAHLERALPKRATDLRMDSSSAPGVYTSPPSPVGQQGFAADSPIVGETGKDG